jgi:hypothetical protein
LDTNYSRRTKICSHDNRYGNIRIAARSESLTWVNSRCPLFHTEKKEDDRSDGKLRLDCPCTLFVFNYSRYCYISVAFHLQLLQLCLNHSAAIALGILAHIFWREKSENLIETLRGHSHSHPEQLEHKHVHVHWHRTKGTMHICIFIKKRCYLHYLH